MNAEGRLAVVCREPFRLLFPLGVAFGFVGVSHWVWYYARLSDTYSCAYHGLVQVQAFEGAFVAGFLMTALPRFLEAPSARPWEVLASALLVLLTAYALFAEAFAAAQSAWGVLILHLTVFAFRRYRRRADAPPASFLFIPFGLFHALAGAAFIAFPQPGFVRLGHLLVEQGAMLCFVLAFGAYLGPRLMSGTPPDEAAASSPGRRRLVLAAGLCLLLSFVIETGVAVVPGRLLRAAAASAFALAAIPLLRRPAVRLIHVRAMWHAFWFVLLGLWLSALFPDYDVLSLHVTFIGGFSLLTLLVASRVVAAHCGFPGLWNKNTRTLVGLGGFFAAAMLTRVLSDFLDWYYFGMLHIAAGFWLLGLLAWAFVFIPRMSPRHIDTD